MIILSLALTSSMQIICSHVLVQRKKMSFRRRRLVKAGSDGPFLPPQPHYAYPEPDLTPEAIPNDQSIFPDTRINRPLGPEDQQFPAGNPEDCATECFGDMLCHAYEYTGAPDNMCTMRRGNFDMNGIDMNLDDGRGVTGLVRGSKFAKYVLKKGAPLAGGPNQAVTTQTSMLYFDVYPGASMQGEELSRNYHTPTAEACGALCYQNVLCKGFGWDPAQNNFCTLLREVHDPFIETNPIFIFGKRRKTPRDA